MISEQINKLLIDSLTKELRIVFFTKNRHLQSQTIFRQIVEYLTDLEEVFIIGNNKRIELRSKSVIEFKVLDFHNIRGRIFDFVFLDETTGIKRNDLSLITELRLRSKNEPIAFRLIKKNPFSRIRKR